MLHELSESESNTGSVFDLELDLDDNADNSDTHLENLEIATLIPDAFNKHLTDAQKALDCLSNV